ncbi:hypothetical protein FNAPI_1892 [Fusarium napiforme]|uniref:Uncharacterized protein n=1 Tax=Fusarium napiforme TaxID=42672 RepID=A0A8H5NGW3_9HYPO|nr:hypothetical protein FNAPI_1892 [Fusarium napiforme]
MMASYGSAAVDVEYTLPYSFPHEEERCENPDQRRDQIASVRSAFHDAKASMSRQSIAEIYEYLVQGEWIHDTKLASGHPAYSRFMGKGKYTKSLYYPQFFVIQAMFVPDPKGRGILESVYNLYAEVSKHWGMQATPSVPFFPRLDDSEEELRLLLGNHRMLSEARRYTAPVHPSPAGVSPMAQDSIIAATPGPSTSSSGLLHITNPPSGISPHLNDINTKFLAYDQRVADLERMIQEKEQELKDKDLEVEFGYKRRYELAMEKLLEAQRERCDAQHQYRESQMLLTKYEEKIKQLQRQLLRSQSICNQALAAGSQAQNLLNLGQQQSEIALSLINEPIEEFNAAAEGFTADDGQRDNKRARET